MFTDRHYDCISYRNLIERDVARCPKIRTLLKHTLWQIGVAERVFEIDESEIIDEFRSLLETNLKGLLHKREVLKLIYLTNVFILIIGIFLIACIKII